MLGMSTSARRAKLALYSGSQPRRFRRCCLQLPQAHHARGGRPRAISKFFRHCSSLAAVCEVPVIGQSFKAIHHSLSWRLPKSGRGTGLCLCPATARGHQLLSSCSARSFACGPLGQWQRGLCQTRVGRISPDFSQRPRNLFHTMLVEYPCRCRLAMPDASVADGTQPSSRR